VHVAAVLFYLIYKRENLIAGMLHGRRAFPADAAPKVSFGSLSRLIGGALLAAVVVWVVARG
jgi:hypothetical protein